MILRAVIVDDEDKARKSIISLISLLNIEVEVIGQADTVKSAYQTIKETKPELVFLDMQMPDGSGFSLLRKFTSINFKIIFITAFDEYAIEAFKFSAVDYLLKPINPNLLKKAINRVIKIKGTEDVNKSIQTLLQNVSAPLKNNKLVLKTSDSINIININDIIRCESDKGYTEFHLHGKSKILVSHVLKDFETLLYSKGFLRTHQSHIINPDYLESYIKRDGGYLLMTDGSSVPIAIRKRASIMEYLNTLNSF